MIPIIFKIKYSEAATGGVTENTWVICVPVNFAKFLRRPFYRTPPDDCFWALTIFKKQLKMMENGHIFQVWGTF